MVALLIMIGAGYFITKKGMMDEHTNNQMSVLIVQIFNPLLVLASASNAVGQVSLDTVLLAGGIAAGMFAVFIAAGMVFSPFFEKDLMQRKIFQLMFVFSNVGFIGIPVISSIFGTEYVIYVSEFMLVYTLIFYTYGIALMDGKLTAASCKAMLNPGTVSGLLALAIIIFNIRLPEFLKTAITYLGNITSPMALIAVGFALANSDIRKIFGQPRLYVFSFVKLLLLPLLLLPVWNAGGEYAADPWKPKGIECDGLQCGNYSFNGIVRADGSGAADVCVTAQGVSEWLLVRRIGD